MEYKLREAVAQRLFQFRVLDGPGNLAWEVPSLHEVNLAYMTDAMFHAKVDSLTRDILNVLEAKPNYYSHEAHEHKNPR